MKKLMTIAITFFSILTFANQFDREACLEQEFLSLSQEKGMSLGGKMYAAEAACDQLELDFCREQEMEKLNKVKGLSQAGKMYQASANCSE